MTSKITSVRLALSKDCCRVALLAWMAISACQSSSLRGEEKPDVRPEAIRPIKGSLMIVGGGIIPPEIIARFLELGGGEQARLVIVTTASLLADNGPEMDLRLELQWKRQKTASFRVLHTRSRDQANDPKFVKALEDATAVWFVGGNQNSIVEAYQGTRTHEQFRGVLDRGGVIGGTSAGAAIMSQVMIAGMHPGPDGQPSVLVKTGLGFAPGLVIDQHFRKRNRQARLIDALRLAPGHVGMGIDESTALVIRGTKAEVIGASDVTIALGAAPGKPAKMESLTPGKSADLSVLSRAAISRMPVAEAAAPPDPKKGTLMLLGHGVAPDEARDRFLTAAGGKNAAIVVVSTGEADEESDLEICEWLRSAGASNVKQLAARSRQDCESPEFVASLDNASGIWLSNGPLRRMVDAYVDTSVQRRLEKLLERDGVLAGSAAGATLSGTTLPVTTETDEFEVMTEAYERGLGFLPGMVVMTPRTESAAAIGFADMQEKYPLTMGVELADCTALIVRGSMMQVIGKHPVTVRTPPPQDAADSADIARVNPGETYSLDRRKRSAAANGD